MIKPKISVIIPVYNTEKYLEQCLHSVVKQTLKNIEIICINDGSYDNSLSILKKYSNDDDRIKIININNSGPSIARNVGLDNATADLIYFLDSDDYIAPNLLEYAVTIFDNFDIDFFCFSSQCFLDENCTRTTFKDGINNYIKTNRDGFFNLSFDTCLNTNIHIWNKVFKKSNINKYNIKFPEKLVYEDIAFTWLYFFTSKNAYYDDSVFHYYRINKDSIMEKHTNNKDLNNGIQHMYNWYYLTNELSKYQDLFLLNFNNLQILLGYYVIKAKEYSLPHDKYKIEKLKQIYLQNLNDIKIKYSSHKSNKIFNLYRENNRYVLVVFGIKFKIRRKFYV